ncbi:MAG: sigma-54 dependent transcriptional regulator, partial [Pseudomonadota bacterium]
MTEGRPPILLVEDTASLSHVYRGVLEKAGYSVDCAFLAEEARGKHAGSSRRLVLLDLMLPDGDGLDLLREMRSADPDGEVIVITANGSINKAVDAMRGGAFDFLVKPFDDRRLLSAVSNAMAGLEAGAPAAADGAHFHGFIGSSAPMRRVYDMIRDIGRSTATVFITGESGTGKEVAAQAIHAASLRASGPFIPLNCAAIPASLLESEVFGHLKGSFTGAISDKVGAAAAADGGTLFLDEICEMDLSLQTKLLRFLQTSTVTPVGAVAPRKVDTRIVCATNRDPVAEVKAGRFREDLFYRLHVVPIHLPPLRDRDEDVVAVAEALLRRFAADEGKTFQRLAPEVANLFRAFPWPGNVRQLQ